MFLVYKTQGALSLILFMSQQLLRSLAFGSSVSQTFVQKINCWMGSFSMPEEIPDTSPFPISFGSALAGTHYGELSRSKLNSLMCALRDAGIESSLDVALPQIVVIGKQSAGKSSLIEAISRVKLPRAARTCTRCPMEVILRTSVEPGTDWHCKVSLRSSDRGGSTPRPTSLIPF